MIGIRDTEGSECRGEEGWNGSREFAATPENVYVVLHRMIVALLTRLADHLSPSARLLAPPFRVEVPQARNGLELEAE